MPRFKKLLEFEDHELEVLKAAAPAKKIADATKPYVDNLKELAKKTQKLASDKQVDTDELSEALEGLTELRQEVENLPDSENKDALLESVSQGRQVIKDALELAQSQ